MYICSRSYTSLRSLAGWAKGSVVSWGFLKLVGVLQFWLNVQRDKFCWPLPFYSFWGCQAESLLEADRVAGPSSQGQPCLYYSRAQQICLRLWDYISQLVGLNPTLLWLTPPFVVAGDLLDLFGLIASGSGSLRLFRDGVGSNCIGSASGESLFIWNPGICQADSTSGQCMDVAERLIQNLKWAV